MFPIDPIADQARRAWLPCPSCEPATRCGDCQNLRNCGAHWQYLLSNKGSRVHLRCRDCGHLWSTAA